MTGIPMKLDQRVDAYVAGRMSESEEAMFCEELMHDRELQRQVVEAGLLARALHAKPDGQQNQRADAGVKRSNGPL